MKQNIERPAWRSSNTIVSRSQFKPIIFSTAMVEAIITGRKTQTRRLMPDWCNDYSSVEIIRDPELCDPKAAEWNKIKPKQCYGLYACFYKGEEHLKCKYDIGNILWVRETFTIIDWWENDKAVHVMYEDAKTAVKTLTDAEWAKFENWADKSERKPSLFLFKSLCRLFLEITDIKAERVQEINEVDSIAEGVGRWVEERMKSKPTHYQLYYTEPGDDSMYSSCPILSYESLWKKINGVKSWNENPYVWAITFKVVECPQGFC